MKLYPVKLSPAYKDYLWGGTRLKTVFNKECGFERVAESWELSAHKDGQSKVCGGAFDGFSLTDYLQKIINFVETCWNIVLFYVTKSSNVGSPRIGGFPIR